MIYILLMLLLISIIPIVICYKKNYKKIVYLILAFDFSFALAVLAYFWEPSTEYDLFQYYKWLDNMRVFKGEILIDYLFFSRGEPLTMIYFYIVALTNNYSLLPFIPTLLGYFIIFYTIIDYCQLKKYDCKLMLILSLIFISLFKYIFLISGIRATFALILCVWALYEEFIKNNGKWYIKLIYLLALGIHNGVLLVIFIRILLSFKKILKIKVKTLVLIIIVTIAISLLFLFLFGDKVGFLKLIKQKVETYLNFETIVNLQYLFRSAQLIFFALILFLVWKNDIYIRYDEGMKKYYKFLQILIIICLIIFAYYNIWIRYLDFVLFLALPIIADLLVISKEKNRIEYMLLIIALTIFIIGGIRIQIPIFEDLNFIIK